MFYQTRPKTGHFLCHLSCFKVVFLTLPTSKVPHTIMYYKQILHDQSVSHLCQKCPLSLSCYSNVLCMLSSHHTVQQKWAHNSNGSAWPQLSRLESLQLNHCRIFKMQLSLIGQVKTKSALGIYRLYHLTQSNRIIFTFERNSFQLQSWK